MGEFAIAAAAVGAASGVASAFGAVTAEEQAEQAITLQAKQKQLQLTQQKLTAYDQIQKTLNRQTAQATVRGVGMDSPSFNAIQRATFNLGSEQLQNINTEMDFVKYNEKISKQNAKNAMYANLFGGLGQTALSFSALTSAYPTKPKV